MSVTERELKLTKEQIAEVASFSDQIVKLGCAVLPVLTREEWEDEVYHTARGAWAKWCRGNERLQAEGWPKVAGVVGAILELIPSPGRQG